jgi:hypothetical protein
MKGDLFGGATMHFPFGDGDAVKDRNSALFYPVR